MNLFSEKKYTWEWLWAVMILSAMLGMVYVDILKHPNQFLVAGGDGMKNYYTFMYHVKYDSTYMTFEGMNYPFGENIIFTDNQPLLVNTAKTIANIFPDLICYLPAVHNMMLLTGLITGALGLFLCFRKRRVNFIFSIICTAGLMLLHPQSDRIHGHFAMFYPVLPWIFLIWLSIWEDGKYYIKSAFIGSIIILTGLLHMYFFITGAILSCLAFFIWIISTLQKPVLKTLAIMFLLQVIIPFAILHFFTSYFNHADDRPDSPWGFFIFHSYWEGLFFSYKLPLYEFIHKNMIKIRDFDVEGKSYLGITAVIYCLYSLSALILHLKARIKKLRPTDTASILTGIFILSALISFGYPFTISGLEGLLDFTGPFKQFRSIGRVAWISFYAINLVAIPAVYHWLKVSKPSVKRDILYFSIPCIILIEGIMFYSKKPIAQTAIDAYYCNNPYTDFPVKGSDYQAILPDPYFNIGSECFSWWDQGHNVNQSFELGYNLHLPTMGVNLSRTSFQQAFMLNELTCQPYKIPEIITLLKKKNQKPLLVLETKNEFHEQRAKLTHWTKIAPIIYESDQYRLRRLDLVQFDTIVKKFNDSLALLSDALPSVKMPLSFKKVKGQNGWGYEAYLPVDSIQAGSYRFSYWLTCTDATLVSAITEVWQFDDLDKNLEYIGEANRFNYKRYNGNRLLIEIPVTVKSEAKKLVFRISKNRQKEAENIEIIDASLFSND